jgi:membrane protease YdiL (CAAX protease family)
MRVARGRHVLTERWLRSDLAATPPERLATAPPATDRWGALLVLAAIVWLAAVGITSRGFTRVPSVAVAVIAALWLTAVLAKRIPAVNATLLCLLMGLAALTGGFGVHPFPLVGALCAYVVALLAYPSLHADSDWLHTGAWGRGAAVLALMVGLLPAAGVPLWRLLEGIDLGPGATLLSTLPWWALPVAGVTVALTIALVEEVAFRGLLLDAAWSAFGQRAALVLQAVVFGLVHSGSVLGGPWGIVLSGLYGYVLGVLRVRTRGMIAPFLAHLLADLVLFGWLVAWTR